MQCYRKLLSITYLDHVTNEDVRNNIKHDDLLSIVTKRKLKWYGHIHGQDNSARDSKRNKKERKRERGRKTT